jgi:hypothetical protein
VSDKVEKRFETDIHTYIQLLLVRKMHRICNGRLIFAVMTSCVLVAVS